MRTEHHSKVIRAKQSLFNGPISCSKRRHRHFPKKPLPTNTRTKIIYKSRQRRLQRIRSTHRRATCSSTRRTGLPSCPPSSSSPQITTTRRPSSRAAHHVAAILAAPRTRAQASLLSFRQNLPFRRAEEIWSGPPISPKSFRMSSLSTTQPVRQT